MCVCQLSGWARCGPVYPKQVAECGPSRAWMWAGAAAELVSSEVADGCSILKRLVVSYGQAVMLHYLNAPPIIMLIVAHSPMPIILQYGS